MTTTLTKADLTEKVGKKFFLADDYTLAAKLNYDNGIPEFDTYLDGKTLKEINAVIHLTKYPKGLVIKIAKNFSSFPFGLAYSEIKRTLLSEKTEKSNLVFETVDKGKITFSFTTANISEVKQFLDDIHLKYDYEKTKSETIKKETKPVSNTKHGVPALLSFFVPGLGQLIKGHFLKAIAIWGSGILIAFLFFGSLYSGQVGLSNFIYLIPFAVWLWNVYDAYNANENWQTSGNETE